MRHKKTSTLTFCITLTLLIIFSMSGLFAQGQEMPFPTYGTGLIQVRLYTDYFCPPCRAMEPSVEPLLKELLRRNAITLTLVDVPFSHLTPLYAKYFLYALKAKNDADHAFHVRNILLDATSNKQIKTKEQMEEHLKGKGIPYAIFETKSAFDRFNTMIKEDNVHSTPTCIIVNNSRKTESVGGPNIIAALKGLK